MCVSALNSHFILRGLQPAYTFSLDIFKFLTFSKVCATVHLFLFFSAVWVVCAHFYIEMRLEYYPTNVSQSGFSRLYKL